MLEAKKNILFERIFGVYNRNLIRRRFNSLQISNLELLLERNKNVPLVIYANHSSWWDGLVAFQISYIAKLDALLMMEEKQLQKLQFFRKLGAFSVVRESPTEAVKSIKYAVECLKKDSKRTLWIFPQGKILPNDFRPLIFYRGLSKIIAGVGNCHVVPMALRFECGNNFKPDIFVKLGQIGIHNENEIFNFRNAKSLFEIELTQLLDNLREEMVQQKLQHFQNLI